MELNANKFFSAQSFSTRVEALDDDLKFLGTSKMKLSRESDDANIVLASERLQTIAFHTHLF